MRYRNKMTRFFYDKIQGRSSLEQVLLDEPIATKTQLATIMNNRKAINEWRKN